MDVGAIGPGPPDTSLSRVAGGVPLALPAMPAVAAASAENLSDSVSTLFTDLSATDIGRLIGLIERPLPAQDTAQLQDLLVTFISAAAEGDAIRALSALSEIAALDPSRPDILRADPSIAPIRLAVDQFLDRHTALARLDAEGRLDQAAQSASPSAPDRLAGWDMRAATMVLIATRVFDSGGLANYVRAGELAQLVIDGSRWGPAFVNLPGETPELDRIKLPYGAQQPGGTARRALTQAIAGMAARLRSLWLRAPLLVLLLSWLLLGIAGGLGSVVWHRFWSETWPSYLSAIAFQVWGTGLLALIVFGFYARVRKVRF